MNGLRHLLFYLAAALPLVCHAQPAVTPAYVNIQGHQYALEMQENIALIAKLGFGSGSQQNRHFRGRLANQPDSWVRLSEVGGKWSGIVSLADQMHIIRDVPGDVEGVIGQQNKQKISVHTLNSQAVGEMMASDMQCASAAAGPALQQKTHSALSAPKAQAVQFDSLCATKVNGVCMFAEVEFAFDLEFQQQLGEAAQATAAAIVNMVEGFYEHDLKISFDVITMQFLEADTFSSSTDAMTVLNDLYDKKHSGKLAFVKNRRGLLHFVTGRNFNGGTAGIAFTDVLCDSRGAGVGTSQLLSGYGTDQAALTALVVAHEIGHNFGANHDELGNSCGAGFIMEQRVSSGTSQFSSCSIEEMSQSISAVPSPGRCFNFPVDVAINDNSENVAEVMAGQGFTAEYAVNTDTAFLSLPQLRVTGSVAADEGSFVAATLNGIGCDIAADGLSYACMLPEPGGVASLKVVARGMQGASAVAYSHTANVGGSTDLFDANVDNNLLVAKFSLIPAPPGTVFAADPVLESKPLAAAVDETASGKSSGGGGCSAGLFLLLLLVFLAERGGVSLRLAHSR